jgi:hypothetical protein
MGQLKTTVLTTNKYNYTVPSKILEKILEQCAHRTANETFVCTVCPFFVLYRSVTVNLFYKEAYLPSSFFCSVNVQFSKKIHLYACEFCISRETGPLVPRLAVTAGGSGSASKRPPKISNCVASLPTRKEPKS